MRQITAVVRYNFMGFWKDPKVIMTFLLGAVLCYLLSGRVMTVVEAYDAPVQFMEPFLWTFGDTAAVLLSSLLVLLLFSDLPRFTPASPYYLYRITKKKWLAGQFFYVACVAGIYTGSIFVLTVVLCVKKSFIRNIWSDTAAMLAYSELGEELSVPSTVKVMESISPLECAVWAVLLLFFYIFCLGFVILAGNLFLGKNYGMLLGLLFSLYGFLLDQRVLGKLLGLEPYEMYKINILIGWISPLSHVVYGRHDFGYDGLPTVWESCLVFAGIFTVLAGIAMAGLKRFHFVFVGEKHGS